MTTLGRLIEWLKNIAAVLGLLLVIVFLLALLFWTVVAIKDLNDESKRISSADQKNRN